MRKIRMLVILLCILPLMFTACSGGGGGSSAEAEGETNLLLSLMDNPGDYLSVYVTIAGIYAVIDGSPPIRLEFADFSSGAVVGETSEGVTFDLIQLSNQEPIEFALGNLPDGNLQQIRLIITEASLTAYEEIVGVDGPDADDVVTPDAIADFPVKVPSGAQTGIKLNPRNVEVQSGSLTSLTLDFDADKSIVKLGGAGQGEREYDFILKPVIFILEAIGAISADTQTVATGLNFPTGVHVAENVGGGSIIAEGSVLVANAGVSGANSNTVLAIDVSGILPIDATALDPFVSSVTEIDGEPLVNSPTGVAQYLDLVWVANAASVVAAANDGTVAEIYTSGIPSGVFIDNFLPSTSSFGLVSTSGVEFGGFAPNGTLAGDDLLVFETNGNGSITGLNLKDNEKFDILPDGTFTSPSDLAFVAEPIVADDPPDTRLGWLYVTDAATNEMTIVELTTTGGNVGEAGTGIAASIVDTLTYAFASEPVGIAFSPGSGRLYIANRGNGSIVLVALDGTEIETHDTSLGGDAINGIAVVSTGTEDVVFLTNTAGNTDPSNDAPGVGASSLERVVVPY
jgi:hypothetical protein